MRRRLLIWGFGRVGSAVVHQLLLQQHTVASGGWPYDSLWVISSKSKPLGMSGVEWLSVEDFVSNAKSFLHPNDVVLLTVSDSQISRCAHYCDYPEISVVHCSGASPKLVMEKAESAVFYPLQTFSSGVEVDWAKVPVFVEAEGSAMKQINHDLATSLGVLNCEEISFVDREKLHLAAVFANNFTIAMAGIAHDILQDSGLNSAWIQPILAQTALNLGSDLPWSKLTGPAKRGDQKTMLNHLELLQANPELKTLYEKISGYIQAKETKA